MIYLVCTKNGKFLTGFNDMESAETARAYWQRRFDESKLAKGVTVEIRKVRSRKDEEIVA